MDKCAKFQEMISALIDNELTEAEREALHAHMSECPDCRRMYDAFAAVAGAEELEEPPEGMLSGAMFKIRNPVPQKKKHALWKRYAAAAACLVLVIFGATQLDFRMGANSAAPAAMELYTMSADNSMSYVSDSAKMESAADAEMSAPADTSLPADAEMPPMPMPSAEPAEDNAAGAARNGLRQLIIYDADGAELYAIADADVLQLLSPMLVSSGTGYSVTATYADGTTAQFILPVNADELKTLLEELE